MPLKNLKDRYGSVSMAFHWISALIVIFLLPLGFLMDLLPRGEMKMATYGLHKSLGISVLALTVFRAVWHNISAVPPPVKTLKPMERNISGAVSKLLYFFLVSVPLAGWFMSSAAGRSFKFFGTFTLPVLIKTDENIHKFFEELHGALAIILLLLISLHIAAALRHHFIEKNDVLQRMIPWPLGRKSIDSDKKRAKTRAHP